MATDETPTVESIKADLEAKIKATEADIPKLEGTVTKAIARMADIPKGSSPAVYVEASGTLGNAQKALEAARSAVAKHRKGIEDTAADEQYGRDMAAYEESIKGCRNVTNPLVSAQQKVVSGAKDTFARADVNSVVTRTTLIEGEILTVVELIGPSKPIKPRRGRKSSGGGGNGGGRYVVVSPNGSQRLSDRDFVELVGPKHIGDEKTQHALTAPGGTLYVTARSLQTKAGWTREQK